VYNGGGIYMARTGFLLALALFGLTLACGQAEDTAPLSRQVDVESLTFEEVRLQAVAALSRPGEVYHEVGTRASGVGGGGFTTEAWLDMERDVARVLEGEWLQIFHEGKVAELGPNGRFHDAEFWPASELTKKAALSLEHIAALFDTNIDSTRIEAAELEGVPAILVEVIDPYQRDYSGTEQWKIYLDESFLPMRIDYYADIGGAPDNEWSMAVQNEFIDPASLPDDFFSPEAVREHEVTPIDDIARCKEFGLEAYWLGEQFEEMALQEVMLMGFDDFEPSEGDIILNMTYHHGPVTSESPGYGVSFAEYTTEGWERRLADIAESGSTPWWERPTVIKTSVIVQGNEATLYEDTSRLAPATVTREGELPPTAESEGQRPLGTVEPNVPPTRTVVPAGTRPGSSWVLVVPLGDTMIEISPKVGDPAINPYVDNTEALLRLAEVLRPFERPPE
jgi:hypothetical protein